jgi:hypothetical protein
MVAVTTYVKVRNQWHVKEADGECRGGKAGSVLHCTGATVAVGFPESESSKSDDAPYCTRCQNPLPTDIKNKIHNRGGA